ncbi:glycosyltransferase family 4 protein [Limisalsivibrio acetivorans]|uniref:glycosyltransferase family 4 protein n=1 Tax=Limisalsivibrio acetivorans TaxID=1304888 RepID=UPI0003B34410|nr:glycosyltransferase family 4 protein [Limisalsivibrio acetivorans]
MKILFVGDASSIHIKKWVDYFDKKYETIICTFSRENKTDCEYVYYLGDREVSVKGGNYHYLKGIPELRRIIIRERPDVLNVHFSYSMGLVTSLANIGTGIPMTVVCHGSDILAPPLPGIMKHVNRFVLKRAEYVFAVSRQISVAVRDLVPSLAVFTGQYGIETEKLMSEKVRDTDIISNRAYVPNSRIDDILHSLGKDQFGGKKIFVALPHISDERFDIIQNENPGIDFVKYINHGNLLEKLGRTKVYVSATMSDGTSLSLLEAIGSGCFPVVSDIPSNREWIKHGVNGYLFNNYDDFEKYIGLALNDEAFRESAAEYNRKLILERGDYKTQMKKVEDILLSLSS